MPKESYISDIRANKDRIRRDFSKRLQEAMIRKGFNQTETARRASGHLPKGKKMGRDVLSNYIRGVALPTPVNLNALCKALGTEPADLLPDRGHSTIANTNPIMDIRQTDDGLAFVRINQAMPMTKAFKILAILNEEE